MADHARSEPTFGGSARPAHDAEAIRRMGRQAGRRRWFALTMMGLMALASAGIAGTFIYNVNQVQKEDAERPSPADQVAVSKKAVKMMAPKVTGFDRKEQAYEINAKVARQDQDEPHIVHMEQVAASLRLKKSGDIVQVTSDEGIYDNESETLKLAGNIVLQTTSRYTARLERAEIWMKDGRIATDRPLTVSAPTGAIAANAMEMWNDGDNIRFFNRARMLFKGDKKDKG